MAYLIQSLRPISSYFSPFRFDTQATKPMHAFNKPLSQSLIMQSEPRPIPSIPARSLKQPKRQITDDRDETSLTFSWYTSQIKLSLQQVNNESHMYDAISVMTVGF